MNGGCSRIARCRAAFTNRSGIEVVYIINNLVVCLTAVHSFHTKVNEIVGTSVNF